LLFLEELSREQLKGVCQACGVQLNEQGYQELFIVCDSDGNGAISCDEFVAWMMSRDLHKDEESMVAYGKHIFGMIDVDGSGEITLDEFRVALRKFNEPPYNAGFTDSEILSLLRDFDEDGDGNISLEEFLKAIENGCNDSAL
jgi:Ca2+-binding EF-hand superfamily protein